MQVDPAVELALLFIKFHYGSPWEKWFSSQYYLEFVAHPKGLSFLGRMPPDQGGHNEYQSDADEGLDRPF
jgi:hypothetical protein